MSFSSLQQLKLTHLLHLGFGLVLLCMAVTLGANLVANTQHQAITDRLIDHLYPARKSANEIIRLALTIDDDGAWYVLSHNPHQRAQLLQTYQQDVQALQVVIARATTLADTPEQRDALVNFTRYFFGSGGYYDDNQQIFAQKRAGQDLAAGDNYVDSPFLPAIQHDMQVYLDVVEREITQQDAEQDALARQVQFINIGLGGSALLFGGGVAVFITRSINRLYRQIEEKNTPAVTALLSGEAAEGGREETALRGTVEALVTLVEERDSSLQRLAEELSQVIR